MFENYNEILTIEDVCEILMIGRNRCYHLLGDGSIKGFRIGSVWKIPREAVISYIQESSASRILESNASNKNKCKVVPRNKTVKNHF